MIQKRRGVGKWLALGAIAGVGFTATLKNMPAASQADPAAAGAWVTSQLDSDAKTHPARRDVALSTCVYPARNGKLDWIAIQRCYARLMADSPIHMVQNGGCPTGAPPFCWTDPKTLIMHCTCGGYGTRAGR
jgi:hypothetical protein